MTTIQSLNDEPIEPIAPPIVVAPLAQTERIASIDVLRGFALLGILILNIQAFSMPGAAYMNPTAYGDLNGRNFWVWYLSHVFADQKFMTIFSMLFGAGIVVMTSRAEAVRGKSAALHYRRMGWLILLGLLHAHLLWWGDILYSYGMCGLAAWFFRRWSPVPLLLVGVALITVPSLVMLGGGWSMSFAPPEQLESVHQSFNPSVEDLAHEIAAYRGSWMEQASNRTPTSLFFETLLFCIWVAWRVGGLMLVGMALYRWGVFSAQRSREFYFRLIVLGLAVGVPIIVYGVKRNFDEQWRGEYSKFYGGEYNYWGSILVSLGWVGVVMLAFKSPLLRPLLSPLTAVGQMALTNYLMHTLICTTIFYGHGFGLFGRVERTGQFAIVMSIWAIQLIMSPIWLKRFQFGPMEWLWRTLTYWKPQPMLRRVTNSQEVRL